MRSIILLHIALFTFSCVAKSADSEHKLPIVEDAQLLSISELANKRSIDIGSAFYYRNGFDHDRYEEEFLNSFTSLTPEDGIIFKLIKPSRDAWNYEVPDKIIEFAHKNHISVRGQHLIWHHYHDNGYLLPEWLLNGNFTKSELEHLMKEFIQTTITHYNNKFPGTVKWWSVVNESVSNSYPGQYMKSFWYDNLGPQYIESAFKYAREVAQDAKLYYNDYYIEGVTDMNHKADFSYKMVKGLVDKGVSIDGVGFQCHFTLDNFPGRRKLQRVTKRIRDLGLDVYFTEVDIKIENGVTEEKLKKQAEYYRVLMELIIDNQPGATITTWGFNDTQTYAGEEFAPVLTDKDFNPKLSMDAIRDTLIHY